MLQTNMWIFLMHIVSAKVYFHNVNSKVSKENILLFIYNNNPYIVLVISASYKNKQQQK